MNATILTTLSLERLVEQGKAMAEQPSSEIDGLWAQNACKLSRQVMAQVEEECPPPDYVQKEVLDAFMAGFPAKVKSVDQATCAEQWAGYLSHFAANIGVRVARLQRYVQQPLFR